MTARPAGDAGILDLGLYCIGSPGYRTAAATSIAKTLDRVSSDDIDASEFLIAAHLDSLFLAEAEHDFRDHKGFEALTHQLAARLRIREITYVNLVAELTNLASEINKADPTVPCVVLKGPASWPYYGDAQRTRRTRDLDLVLGHPSDADVVCDVLDALGYQSLAFENDPRSTREHLWEFAGFSAPPMRLFRQANLDGTPPHQVRDLLRSTPNLPDIDWDDDKGMVLTIDVEIHMALMRMETGRLLRHKPSDIVDHAQISGVHVLSKGAMLAYLAAKLNVDVFVALSDNEVEPKCLKLAADFLRILLTANQSDLDEAFAVAKRWDCLHHLLSSLRSLKPFAPELSLGNLPASQDDDLFDLYRASLVSTEDGVRVYG